MTARDRAASALTDVEVHPAAPWHVEVAAYVDALAAADLLVTDELDAVRTAALTGDVDALINTADAYRTSELA